VTLQHPHAELSAYIDGALAAAAQAAVEGHVDACAVCRAHVAELRATVGLLQALPDPVPSRRLMPRLVGASATPAWLAPLRTVMTLASGTAVFLFIASSLVSNITFLASGGAPTGTTAQEAATRDTSTNFQVQSPTAAQPETTPSRALGAAPVTSPNLPPSPAAAAGAGSSPSVDGDASKRSDGSTAVPAPGAGAPQDAGSRLASSEPQRSLLLNPWLWLTLALVCGAIAFALQRRLRRSL
jgi:hypothetical protein